MKTILPESIKTVYEAKEFLMELTLNGEAFHPEDDAHEVIWALPTEQIPTEDECEKLNDLMADIFFNINAGYRNYPVFDPCEYLIYVKHIIKEHEV